MAKVNKFLREQTIEKGCFALPFLVRYALRLYDGSLVCHSAPILMNPSTDAAPVVFWLRTSGKGKYTDATCDIMLVASTLDYQLIADENYDYLYLAKNWSDIVKSVDVFISKPIYTWDQNGQCSSFADTDNFKTKFIGTLKPAGYADNVSEDCILLPLNIDGVDIKRGKVHSVFTDDYREWEYAKLYALYKSTGNGREYPSTTIHLPEFSAERVHETIKNTSTFYKLCSIEISDLSTSERKDIKIDDDYLPSLVNREAMTDDYLTHDRLTASYSHAYNSRLNISGLKRELFRGFTAGSMFSYKNRTLLGWKTDEHNNIIYLERGTLDSSTLDLKVYIKEDGQTYAVSSSSNNLYLSYFLSPMLYPTDKDKENNTNGFLDKMSWGCYVFYPNANAFKMEVKDFSGSYQIDLKPHDFLNGAYGLLDYELQRASNITQTSVTAMSNIVSIPNKIYTSEVNNPFYFPLSGINTVGTGNIIGICSAVKALSQGQFGQFPLYAFTDEGVWALELSSTGTYSARQPVTRDVCINAASLTQIDTAVLFATDRGVMLIQGSETVCITDTLNGDNTLSLDTFPKIEQIAGLSGFSKDDFALKPFHEFVRNCRMVYDYRNQRIIVYNPACTYAYIYSLKSKRWGMMRSSIADSVNSYPDALAVLKDGKLVNFSVEDTESDYRGIVVTRPFKLDMPDVLKTIDTVIQRGFFRKGHVRSALYASRDMFNWFLVWTSSDHYLRGFSGSPYKYFRLVLLCDLKDDENLSGFSVRFTPRLTNRIR